MPATECGCCPSERGSTAASGPCGRYTPARRRRRARLQGTSFTFPASTSATRRPISATQSSSRLGSSATPRLRSRVPAMPARALGGSRSASFSKITDCDLKDGPGLLKAVFEAIRELMMPPERRRRRIGFGTQRSQLDKATEPPSRSERGVRFASTRVSRIAPTRLLERGHGFAREPGGVGLAACPYNRCV